MEKETPEFFALLPTELRSELVAAVFKTNSSTHESMKTVKKLMLTSKQTQTQLKQFFNTDDKIIDYCFALKSNTENIFRSLYLFNVYKFIPKQKYNQLDAQFFIYHRDEYDAHRQDEKTFITEFISDEFITKAKSPSDLDRAQQWINKGIDTNIQGVAQSTALMAALWKKHTELAELFITAPGFKVTTKNMFGDDALKIAVDKNQVNPVKRLLSMPGIDVNHKNNLGNTALKIACRAEGDHTGIVKLLLATPGINVNSKNNTGVTALISAAYWGRTDIVKLLLATPGIDINSKNNLGHTALNDAIQIGVVHPDIVKLLLAMPGIDVNSKNNTGVTALMGAAYWGRTDIVKQLLATPGIDVNFIDRIDGNTALILAANKGHITTTQELLKAPGIDIGIINNYGFTAFQAASNEEIKKVLLNFSLNQGIIINRQAIGKIEFFWNQ